jgi:hypothetical protein
MSDGRDRRLARLERCRRPSVETLYFWRDAGKETGEEAIARCFPKGVPAGAKIVICRWRVPREKVPPAHG